MNPIPDSVKKAGFNAFSLFKDSRQNLNGAKIAITIRSYPKYTCAVAQTARLCDAGRLSQYLKNSRCHPLSSSLYGLGNYYLCLTLKTTDALKLLPAICEHSERVFLGKSYEAEIKEHACPLINENAILKLGS